MRAFASAVVALLVAAATMAAPARASADTLHGRVVTADNLPVPRAQVLVFRALTLEATLVTDAAGHYGPAPLRPGTYEVLVAARGFAAEPVTVTIGSGSADIELNLTVTPVAANDYVVVTAPPLGVDALSRITRQLITFDRVEVLALQADSLADVLRLVPGLQVQARGGKGAPATITGWGGDATDLLVIIDGVPQNQFGGLFDAAHISAADIDHIDVMRGVDSIVSGVGAPSATVYVTTVNAVSSGLGVSVEGGLEPSGRAAIDASHAGDAWKWHGTGEWLGTRGQNGRRATSGAAVANDDYTRIDGSASLMWQDQPDRFARFQARVSDTSRGLPGPWGSDPLGYQPGVDTVSRGTSRTEAAGFSGAVTPFERFTHRVDLSFAHWHNDFTSPVYASDVDTRRFLFHYHLDVDLSRTTLLTTGIERQWESSADSLVRDTANLPLTLSRSFASWFAEIRQSAGTRVFLNAGARYDMVQRGALDGNETAAAFRPKLEATTEHQFNWRGAATAILHRDRRGGSTTARVHGGTSITPATLEAIGFSENPGLRPERSSTISAGIEQVTVGRRVTFNADGFHYHVDDLIVPVVVQRDAVRRVVTDNVASAQARGVTLGATVKIGSHIVASGGATWMSTRVLQARCACTDTVPVLPIGDGTSLVRRPRVAGAASLVWTSGRVTAFLTAGGRGVMRDVEPTRGEALFNNAGYVTLSAGTSVTLASPAVQLFARVTNLLDREYEEILGYPAPRRAFVMGLRLTAR